MDIFEALKSTEHDIRLTSGLNVWLLWDDGEWHVYQRRYRARQSECLYRGASLVEAIRVLLKKEATNGK